MDSENDKINRLASDAEVVRNIIDGKSDHFSDGTDINDIGTIPTNELAAEIARRSEGGAVLFWFEKIEDRVTEESIERFIRSDTGKETIREAMDKGRTEDDILETLREHIGDTVKARSIASGVVEYDRGFLPNMMQDINERMHLYHSIGDISNSLGLHAQAVSGDGTVVVESDPDDEDQGKRPRR